ncbi:hypothetical protein [Paracoccus aestuariivivens]|uniref:Uncharacterized protein n=1 Tax=Paracoccus aestuariivivens TaxID=1820333 RepID=A0A6L6J370_9RHOB|nr:hypothetical protein [Paracoccus aestuariivivens]MTH76583.1 hypothetical protein [Paracoccus aestuariivivens]
MTALETLRRVAADQSRDRLLSIGIAASAVWLVVVGIFVWLDPDGLPQDMTGWLVGLVGALVPLALIWFGVWSARSLALLRAEADDLRASLHAIRASAAPPVTDQEPRLKPRSASVPRHVATIPAPQADNRQDSLDLGTQRSPELTPTELVRALNFPDGPDDHEAIRCLKLALGDPELARLIRAAQDVVTLLAGQGVYMDDLGIPETDPELWRQFAEGQRGESVSALAVIEDDSALDIAAQMMRMDEVFRDVAQHFLRHFDRLLARRAEIDDPVVLAVLAESRSGRAFVLLAQTCGMLGRPYTLAKD